MKDSLLKALSFDRTYEELKRVNVAGVPPFPARFDRTYEELKLVLRVNDTESL